MRISSIEGIIKDYYNEGMGKMNLIKRYPVAAVFVFYVITACLMAYASGAVKSILLAVTSFSIVSVFVLCLVFKKRIADKEMPRVILLLLAAILVADTVSYAAYDVFANRIDKQSGAEDTVTLRVISCDYTLSYMAQYIVSVDESENAVPDGTKIILRTPLTSLTEGDILRGSVAYSSLEEESSRTFDAVKYYLSKKIFLVAEDVSLSRSGHEKKFRPASYFENLSTKLSSKILAGVGTSEGGIAAAVLLGNKDYLSASVERDFRRIGISHLLVVSGTHFAVIVSFAENAMRRFRINRRYRAGINLLIIFGMMCLTGFTPSVVRAGIMHTLVQLSFLVNRRSNVIHSLAISAALMITVNPYIVADVGFQLSFIASYSCILYYRFSKISFVLKKMRYRRKGKVEWWLYSALSMILGTFFVTAVVNICTLPLMWLHFGEISLISIPSNVVFIPLITALMYLSGLHLLLYPLKIFIYPTSFLLGAGCDVIEKIAAFFAKADFALLSVDNPFAVYFLVPLSLLMILFPLGSQKARKTVAVSAVTVFAAFFVVIGVTRAIDSDNVHFTYISENKNDGIVVAAQGKVLLCDVSDGSSGFFYQLSDEMAEYHACEIDALMFTHYHNKHVQLLGKMCEREIVRRVMLPEPIDEREEGIYASLIDAAEHYGVDIVVYSLDKGVSFGDAEIRLIDRTYISRSTHPITAIDVLAYDEKITYASCSFNQGSAGILSGMESADYVIFGRHSPVYKKPFAVSFSDTTKGIAVSKAAYEYMDEATRRSLLKYEVEWEPSMWRITLSEKP